MENEFQVTGTNAAALFSLKVHRGDGMALLAMNWKEPTPPLDFVGFAIEYKVPNGQKFFSLKNRIRFLKDNGSIDPNASSTLRAPIQKFRWVHFPFNAELPGKYTYKVSPVFMNPNDELSYGEAQFAEIELNRDTYPGILNVAYTRGFVLSQAFVDRYESQGAFSTLIPGTAKEGLTFQATHPKAEEAYAWMGFEARNAILEVLDLAINDPNATVRVIAYDLNEPVLVEKMEQLGNRLRIIIDDSGEHGKVDSGETQAFERLVISAGDDNVKRHHMGGLQHNKTIIVESPDLKLAVGGSTNFSWRGFFVQANSAVIFKTAPAVQLFIDAFENYFQFDSAGSFGNTDSSNWNDLGLVGIDAQINFSPHTNNNAILEEIAADISSETTSSLLYSLAFLFQTPGAIKEAVEKKMNDPDIFVYGISDKEVGGLDIQRPNSTVSPVFPEALVKGTTPEPFKSEPKGGGGNRMHHKFVVIDFDKPTARVYMGSYNFSIAADTKNGENLLLIKDRKIATSFMIEAIRLFDHYHFRIAQLDAERAHEKLFLRKPPAENNDQPWWTEYYEDETKIKDRTLFS